MLSSTASNFVNSFWLQGDTTEINVLQVDETGAASTSYYCYNDPDDQVMHTTPLPAVDLTANTTVALYYTADQIKVLVNGHVVHEIATPTCMQGGQMQVIWSVEGGAQTLPPVTGMASGDSFGAMSIQYVKKFQVKADASGDARSCKVEKKALSLRFLGANCAELTIADKSAIAAATKATVESATVQTVERVDVAC